MLEKAIELGCTQQKEEIIELLGYLKGKVNSFIEIGTYKGGTFLLLSSICSGKKISIDFCDTSKECYRDFIGGSTNRNNNIQAIYPDAVFIEGDSHEFSTQAKLVKELAGEQVDLLFIDGDHSYEGVKADYVFYKQFVKEGGYIVFHDVLDCDFHKAHECYVDIFWRELSGVKKEIITTNEWGGIGVLENKNTTSIFQIYYDKKSMSKVDKNLIPFINTSSDGLYENSVIEKIYDRCINSDYIGTCSWKLYDKSLMSGDYLLTNVNKADYDVYIYSPPFHVNVVSENRADVKWGIEHDKEKIDVWKLNKLWNSELYKLAKFINDSNVLEFDLFAKPWVYSFCNFWTAKREVFNDYVKTTLKPALNFMRANYDEVSSFKFPYDKNPEHSAVVFFFEGLFGSFLANRDYSVKHLQGDNIKLADQVLFNKDRNCNQAILSGLVYDLQEVNDNYIVKDFKVNKQSTINN